MSILMTAENMQHIPIGSALAYSLLGFAIVFVALIILWGIIAIMSAIFRAVRAKKEAPAKAAIDAPAANTAVPAPKIAGELAPGSAGDLMIHDVPEKTAAILMAIVADKMGRPLNELRFISIKEVK
ncbi:MAG: OadG family protein [Oscillospiraceae bacterium]|nr:OadG family protein [Oscillospiraceae bacterium]